MISKPHSNARLAFDRSDTMRAAVALLLLGVARAQTGAEPGAGARAGAEPGAGAGVEEQKSKGEGEKYITTIMLVNIQLHSEG